MIKRVLLVCACVLLPALASSQSPVPVLTELEGVKLDSAIKSLRIAQLEEEAAKAKTQQALDGVNALIRSLQREGFDFDVRTRTYAPKKKDGGNR